ncbi:HAMP domain-containing histidine kinase [Pseudomonas sp. Fig-3]|uniref:sensor histidine kinase n=1 Tax=unclassified Pseudomonas TaxID=196821 RepID=UPI0010F0C83E|nr:MULTISPECIES: HAMP domain-containing sensor histidine kinase [unclassified Pseudomonas]TNB81534.1 HAMP domain-containing histidine kinase [Pseudomonas sp. Fig-3]VII91663.1 Two-component system sensor histidine kinase [Pseudomonas sp. FG-3G]
MRLSDFIFVNMKPILRAWEDFARSVETPMPDLDARGLRNHAQLILRTVALDMRTFQTEQQQIDKSFGHGPVSEDETPAQSHAVNRLVAGFTLDQMVSEYRALRSSVLRLWLEQEYTGDGHHVEDMVRFNEAIDQALVESIAAYWEAVETTRKMVLGVLGHDLRSPLSAVLMGADLLRKSKQLPDREKTIAAQIATSVRGANQMVNDLLDLARCNLGTGLTIKKEITQLHSICQGIVNEIRAGHPQAQIVFNDTEKIVGQFDPARIAQVFSNLIGNAVRHGDLHQPIHVTLKGDGTSVFFNVVNFGDPIPPDAMPILFNPEGRFSRYSDDNRGETVGLGLGLFIAAEIVAGHDGKIEAESTQEQGTVFRISLPIL